MSTATATEAETLILTGEGYGLSISPDAVAEKAALIQSAAAITVVTTNEQAEEARLEVKKLAATRNQVGKAREKIKAPVLKIGREIDDLAKSYLAELEQQEKRLTGLIGDHAAEVERLRQAAIRKRQEEDRARLAAEAEARRKEEEVERQRLIAEAKAEEARKAAEAAAWAEDDDTDAEKAKEEAAKAAADAEAERARVAAEAEAEMARIKEMAKDRIERLAQASLVANTEATAGVKFDWDFEVEDVAELYAWNPSLVNLEPRRSDILAHIKSLALHQKDGEVLSVPGLKVIKKAKVLTR